MDTTYGGKMRLIIIPQALIGQALLGQLIESRPSVLLLPGGRSIIPFFDAWKQSMHSLPGSMKNVEIFSCDERLVPVGHPDRNMDLFINSCGQSLIAEGMLQEKQIHQFQDLEQYTREFAAATGGTNSADLVILGVGEDGHIAAIPPQHDVLQNDEEYFTQLHDMPKPPASRMTCTPRLLREAKQVWLLFLGEGKRAALERFMDDTTSVEDIPAKLVKEKAIVFTDLEGESWNLG